MNFFKYVSVVELGLISALIAVCLIGIITVCAGGMTPRPPATDPERMRGIEPVACYLLKGRYRDTELCRYNLPGDLTCVYGSSSHGLDPACFPTPTPPE